jgi:hypothetical protein
MGAGKLALQPGAKDVAQIAVTIFPTFPGRGLRARHFAVAPVLPNIPCGHRHRGGGDEGQSDQNCVFRFHLEFSRKELRK